jgi:hypothetical protein
MLIFLSLLAKLVFRFHKSKSSLLCEIVVLKKEIEILKRHHSNKKITFQVSDKLFFVMLNKVTHMKNVLNILKPETVLRWQKSLIAYFWQYKHRQGKRGRPPVKKKIRELVLEIKNDNNMWGVKKIQGELIKLGIQLDTKTIWNILQHYRRNGKLKRSLTWRKFLQMQISSIFAMDYFTIDTIRNQRFHVHFVLAHKTREIIQFAITENPTREFVKQQMIEFSEAVKRFVRIIHDNDVTFNIDFTSFNIESLRTAIASPNMNAIAERFIGSIRREALDHFILLNKKQIHGIIAEYVHYYNNQRPHQGLKQNIPKSKTPCQSDGDIRKVPVLSGIHHHYYREVA